MHFEILFWTKVSFLFTLHFVMCNYTEIFVFETKHSLQKCEGCNKVYVIILSASQLEMKDIILFSSVAKVTIKEPPDTVQPEGHK
jgi:hypothetical protein